jgi:hypothetical protein
MLYVRIMYLLPQQITAQSEFSVQIKIKSLILKFWHVRCWL